MTGLGVLYVNKYLPEVATVFTTHATSIKQVFIVVGLVHKQTVHTQLLKSYHIVFSPLGLQLFQSGFQRLSGTLQLLEVKRSPPLACTSAIPSVISSICS